MNSSPHARIVIDEAYHDYVTDPAHRTQIPLALENPRVIVVRTFSKAFGMAGLRVGYAVGHADTIKELSAIQYGSGTNALGLSAALASFPDQERLDRLAQRASGELTSTPTGTAGPTSDPASRTDRHE